VVVALRSLPLHLFVHFTIPSSTSSPSPSTSSLCPLHSIFIYFTPFPFVPLRPATDQDANMPAVGKPVSHAFAKELLVGLAGAEIDKLAETKGMDFVDREKAKHHAKKQVESMYDEHYIEGQNADQYDPYVIPYIHTTDIKFADETCIETNSNALKLSTTTR